MSYRYDCREAEDDFGMSRQTTTDDRLNSLNPSLVDEGPSVPASPMSPAADRPVENSELPKKGRKPCPFCGGDGWLPEDSEAFE